MRFVLLISIITSYCSKIILGQNASTSPGRCRWIIWRLHHVRVEHIIWISTSIEARIIASHLITRITTHLITKIATHLIIISLFTCRTGILIFIHLHLTGILLLLSHIILCISLGLTHLPQPSIMLMCLHFYVIFNSLGLLVVLWVNLSKVVFPVLIDLVRLKRL